MSSLQHVFEYEEEEYADDTREQDEYYSFDDYDFDPSYDFDYEPEVYDTHEEYDEETDFQEEDIHNSEIDYYEEQNEYDHYHEEFDEFPEETDHFYDEEYDHFQNEDEFNHFQDNIEYNHFDVAQEEDHFQDEEHIHTQDQEYDHFQESEFDHFLEGEYEHNQVKENECNYQSDFFQDEEYDPFKSDGEYDEELDSRFENEFLVKTESEDDDSDQESYWDDLEVEQRSNYANYLSDVSDQDSEVQILDELESRNQFEMDELYSLRENNHRLYEYEYQLQKEYEQYELQVQHEQFEQHEQHLRSRNEGETRAGGKGGYNHYENQATYSLQNHLAYSRKYPHELERSEAKQNNKRKHFTSKAMSSSFHSSNGKSVRTSRGDRSKHRPIEKWEPSKVAVAAEKITEIIGYPFHISLGVVDKIISKSVTFGFRIVAFPIRSMFSKYQNYALQASEKKKCKHIKEDVIELYHQGFSKSEMVELLGVTYEAIAGVLNDLYKSLIAHSNGSETTVTQNKSEIKLEEENNNESEIQVDDDIQEIIDMYQQGYSAEDIAQILSLQLPFVKMILNALYFSKGSQESTLHNSQIPFSGGTHSRYVDVGFETILFPKYGPPIQASDLQRLSPEELKASGPFLMFDQNNKPVYSHIHSANFVKANEALRVTSLSGIDAVVGVNTKSLNDELTGIESEIMKETEKSYCFIARDYSKFGSAFPSPFELLKGGHLDIFFHMKKDVAVRLNQKLNDKYPSIRDACRSLDLKYSRITDSYHKRSYTYKELLRINQAINYPNVFSHKFLDNVISIGAGGRQKKVNNFVKPEFFNVLGLIASDGYIGEYLQNGQYRIGFANKDKNLLKKFKKQVLEYFPEMTLGDSFNQNGVP
ncbi:MAG: hypothetical protein HeimC2_11560 [Candidatus Heimdallarchaeota archaeon LC_2]|nr:MAG: hypothetical protein HeimC2_11560 [Candidatus Heimdallarchaeota archaeon LC_2]